MKKQNQGSAPDSKERKSDSRGTATEKSPAKDLDFSKLDLTVERVDERMSPSETNIFDK